MPIKKRKQRTPSQRLERMGAILEAGFGDYNDAQFYTCEMYRCQLQRLQSIVAKAESNKSWSFMKGCYKQAAELYVLASVLYEKHPEHVIMTDAAYDHLGRWLLVNFKKLPKDFRDWYNLTAIDLRAGTGHHVQEQTAIRWMVAIHTGALDDKAPPVRSRVLQRDTERGSKRAKGDTGKTPNRRVRKIKRVKRRRVSSHRDTHRIS